MFSHPRHAAATLVLALAVVACNDPSNPQEPVAGSVRASAAASTGGDHALINGQPIQWGDALPCFRPGAKLAVIEGNPLTPGKVWAVRILFPDGYVVDPHWHPTDENVTVLSGTLLFGFGDTFDESTMTAYGKGGFVTAAAHVNHYVKARGRTEIQLHGMGPFALFYVDNAHGDVPDCPLPSS